MSALGAPASSAHLRKALVIDAAASGGMGLGLLLAGRSLAAPLGLPPALLSWSGAFLVPFALFLVWLSRRPAIPRPVILTVIIGNALWIAASAAILLTGWVAPTTAGLVLVIGQALAVAVFVDLEYAGLKR